MDIINAIQERHSVRQYTDREIDTEILQKLQDEIKLCNSEGNLHIQLVLNESFAFDGFMAHYGKFKGVKNYIALVGEKCANLDEKCGYFGERLVLSAQAAGLNSCWVGLTYKKIPNAFKVLKGEKLTAVIALGYGRNPGKPHKSKEISKVSNLSSSFPDWFKQGVNAALLAPTAMNQQKFYISYSNGEVHFKKGTGFYTKMDLGIVKYHFEVASGYKINI